MSKTVGFRYDSGSNNKSSRTSNSDFWDQELGIRLNTNYPRLQHNLAALSNRSISYNATAIIAIKLSVLGDHGVQKEACAICGPLRLVCKFSYTRYD